MLRDPDSAIDFAHSAPLQTSNATPLTYPSVRAVQEPQHVLVISGPTGRREPGYIDIPAASWEHMPAHLRAVAENAPVAGADFMERHLAKLAKAAESMRSSHQQVIEEYREEFRRVGKIDETKFVEWFNRVTLARNEAIELVDILGVRNQVESIGVNVISKATYDELVRAYAVVSSMPDGPGRDRVKREMSRRLVLDTDTVLRQKIEVSSKLAAKLQQVNFALLAVEWIGPSARLLSARKYGEFKEAVIDVAAVVGSWAGGALGGWLVPAAGVYIAVALNLTPVGWVVTALCVAGGTAGGYLVGELAKSVVKEQLPKIDPNTTLP